MFYNSNTLIEYCNKNNIQLLKNYDKIKRDNYIEGKCMIVKITFIKHLDKW